MQEPRKKLTLKKQKLRNLTDVELNAVAAASDPHGVPPEPAPPRRSLVMVL